MTDYDWMPEARQIAAQCWCAPETATMPMDSVLAERFAVQLASWMKTAAQNVRNVDYYRGLVTQCGKAIGPPAYTQDDGNVCHEVLCAKVPELVEKLVKNDEAQLDVLLEFYGLAPVHIETHGTDRNMTMLKTRIDYWFKMENEQTILMKLLGCTTHEEAVTEITLLKQKATL